MSVQSCCGVGETFKSALHYEIKHRVIVDMIRFFCSLCAWILLCITTGVYAVEPQLAKHPTYKVKCRLLEIALQHELKPISLHQAEKILLDLEQKDPESILKMYPFFEYASLISKPETQVDVGQVATHQQGKHMTLKNGADYFIGTSFKTEIKRAHLNFVDVYVDLYQSKMPQDKGLQAIHLKSQKELVLHDSQWLGNDDLLAPVAGKKLVSRKELRDILLGQATYQGEGLMLWVVYAEVEHSDEMSPTPEAPVQAMSMD